MGRHSLKKEKQQPLAHPDSLPTLPPDSHGGVVLRAQIALEERTCSQLMADGPPAAPHGPRTPARSSLLPRSVRSAEQTPLPSLASSFFIFHRRFPPKKPTLFILFQCLPLAGPELTHAPNL